MSRRVRRLLPGRDGIPDRSARCPAGGADPPPDAGALGGKGGYGHRHRAQEEIYYVVSGTLQFKLEDEVGDVPAGSAVRVAPAVTRSIWNDGPGDAELVICSVRLDDPHADGELVDGFWSVDGGS